MLDHRAEFFPELLVAVIDAIHVGTRPGHALHDPTRLFDVLIAHLVQRELRRVEGYSVLTVRSRGCPERDQSFVSARELGVAEHPIERVGVLLQDRVRHLRQPVGNETEVLLEPVEDLLPSHRTPPFSRFPWRVDSNKYSIPQIGVVVVHSSFLQEGLWARERHGELSLFTGMPRAGVLGNSLLSGVILPPAACIKSCVSRAFGVGSEHTGPAGRAGSGKAGPDRAQPRPFTPTCPDRSGRSVFRFARPPVI